MKRLSVVLVSGGMDSCVTAAMADIEYRMAFLHLNYRQRTEERELKAFHDIADFYEVKQRLIVDIEYLKEIGGSALTNDGIDVPVYRSLKGSSPEIPPTYVPFRNAHLLSIATSWAEVIGADAIFIGAVEEDSSGYPDCREGFYRAFEKAIEMGTKKGGIRIFTPLIHMTKAEIVRKGIELKAPLHLTWSCYKENEVACGECESCLLRLKGFREAGAIDPIPYIKMPLDL